LPIATRSLGKACQIERAHVVCPLFTHRDASLHHTGIDNTQHIAIHNFECHELVILEIQLGKKGSEQVLCSSPFGLRPASLPCFRLCAGGSYFHPDQPHAPQGQGESGFTDGSGPLFSMYLERAEDQDEKMADRWKADADGILVFVSSHSGTPLPFARRLVDHRPVCFLLLLRRLSGSPSRTLSQIRRIPPRSILRTSISSSPVQMGPVSSSFQHHPLHRNSLRPRRPYGSTLSGF
jgi:hypothetical protein